MFQNKGVFCDWETNRNAEFFHLEWDAQWFRWVCIWMTFEWLNEIWIFSMALGGKSRVYRVKCITIYVKYCVWCVEYQWRAVWQVLSSFERLWARTPPATSEGSISSAHSKHDSHMQNESTLRYTVGTEISKKYRFYHFRAIVSRYRGWDKHDFCIPMNIGIREGQYGVQWRCGIFHDFSILIFMVFQIFGLAVIRARLGE